MPKAATALAHADVYAAHHESVRATVLQHPALPPDKPFMVVPHGRDWERIQWMGQLPKKGQALQILVPGQLVKAKGLDVVQALAALDGGNRLHLHLLGSGGLNVKPAPGLTVHCEYRPQVSAPAWRRFAPTWAPCSPSGTKPGATRSQRCGPAACR